MSMTVESDATRSGAAVPLTSQGGANRQGGGPLGPVHQGTQPMIVEPAAGSGSRDVAALASALGASGQRPRRMGSAQVQTGPPQSGPLRQGGERGGLTLTGDKALSAGDFASLQQAQRDKQLDTAGTHANATVTMSYLARPAARLNLEADMTGQLLFMYQPGTTESLLAKAGARGRTAQRASLIAGGASDSVLARQSSRRHAFFSLAGANCYLTHELAPEKAEVPLPGPEEQLDKWFIPGIVNTEEGAAITSDGYEKERDRLFNFTVAGTQHAHNIWGDDVDAGTKLWLLFKRQPAARTYFVDAAGGAGPAALKPGVYPGGHYTPDKFVKKPFQFVPWASSLEEMPTDKDLEYVDDNGYPCTGQAIYVGKTRDPVIGVSSRRRCALKNDSYYNQVGVAQLPLLEMIVNVQKYL